LLRKKGRHIKNKVHVWQRITKREKKCKKLHFYYNTGLSKCWKYRRRKHDWDLKDFFFTFIKIKIQLSNLWFVRIYRFPSIELEKVVSESNLYCLGIIRDRKSIPLLHIICYLFSRDVWMVHCDFKLRMNLGQEEEKHAKTTSFFQLKCQYWYFIRLLLFLTYNLVVWCSLVFFSVYDVAFDFYARKVWIKKELLEKSNVYRICS